MEHMVKLHIEHLPEGMYLATSDEVQGLIAQGRTIAETIEIARESGSPVRKKADEIYDNTFVNNLEKSGFLKEIWGNENYRR